MKLNSLAARLFGTAVLWTAIALPIAGIAINSLYQAQGRSDFDDRLRTFLYIVFIEATSEGTVTPKSPDNIGDALFEIEDSGYYWQIAPTGAQSDGKVLTSKSLRDATLEVPDKTTYTPDSADIRWWNAAAGPDGGPLRHAELRVDFGPAGRETEYSLLVTGPLEWVYTRERAFQTRLTIALTLVGLALLAFTFLQIKFGLYPLRQIGTGLGQIRSGEASELEGQLPAEIEPLQTELNALIKSNQAIIDRARTQVGNLAHALKTPLAVIINEAESATGSADGEQRRKVAEQAQIMRTQIAHYLDRARVAARIDTVAGMTPVAPVVASLERALERIYQDRAVEITCVVADGAAFAGEKQDLEEILGNLMDNACKWCRGAVSVGVETPEATQDAAGHIVITVDDDGPGLDAEQRLRIVARGFRLDETKPGSGLGLSIVSDLVSLYRGTFSLDEAPNGGLRARVTLPSAGPASSGGMA